MAPFLSHAKNSPFRFSLFAATVPKQPDFCSLIANLVIDFCRIPNPRLPRAGAQCRLAPRLLPLTASFQDTMASCTHPLLFIIHTPWETRPAQRMHPHVATPPPTLRSPPSALHSSHTAWFMAPFTLLLAPKQHPMPCAAAALHMSSAGGRHTLSSSCRVPNCSSR